MSTFIDFAASSHAALTHGQLDALLRTHAGRLASFVRRRIGNPADVEDIVQDTLVEALRCLDRFEGHSKPETWLFGIALNLTRDHYKRARVRDIYSDVDTDDVPGDQADDPADIADHRQRMARVARAMDSLPHDVRELIQFILDDELSYKDIAEQLGVPVGTVRSRISRARSVLREFADGTRKGCPTPGTDGCVRDAERRGQSGRYATVALAAVG